MSPFPIRVFAIVAAVVAAVALVLGGWLGHVGRPQPPSTTAASVPISPSSAMPPEVVPESRPSHPQSSAKGVSIPATAVPQPLQTAASGQQSQGLGPVPAAPPASGTVAARVLGTTPVTAVAKTVRSRKTVTGRAYLRVYARQFVTMSDVVEHRLSRVTAARVLVDDNPSQALASGHWALITPGKHRLEFYPAVGLPFDPNTKFWMQIGPHQRRAFQIPLPRHPGSIQPPNPKKRPPRPV